MTAGVHTFKNFPELSKLTLNDRKAYESLISDYPPISDLSFATMMMWWNFLDTAAVAQLNGNLVLSYWLPGLEKYSGLSIVGTSKIDESVCTIFDYLRSRGERVRLVHVPEVVVNHMQYTELFSFKEERDFDEYIVPVDSHYPLARLPAFRRSRVRTFLKHVDESDVVVKMLNLDDARNQQLLLAKTSAWRHRGTLKQLHKLEAEALDYGIRHATLIGLENVCLFVRGELQGFCLYQPTHDKRYAIIHHARAGNDIPRTFDYLIYMFAQWLMDRGITFANIEMDLGLPLLRVMKVSLKPTNFFRKYTIEPSKR